MFGPLCVVCGKPVDTNVSVFIRQNSTGEYDIIHAHCEGGIKNLPKVNIHA